jgi:hypothetical protein
MAHKHEALLFLPDALADAGLPFAQLSGWESNQQGYYWVDENGMHQGYLGMPNGWMWHHTATQAYTPSVSNAGRTIANIYIGIWRNGRLWSFGNGEPLVVLASSGPANYSSGSGRRNVLTNYVALDVRFPGPQDLPDDIDPPFFGNRRYGNTEVIHPGDGTALDPDVWDLQVETAAVISKHFGWSEFRNIGHLDHTRRKIDQRFAQGAPYTIRQHQVEIQLAMNPPPPQEDDMLPVDANSGKEDIRAIQEMLNAAYGTDLTPTGDWDDPTIAAVATHTGHATGNNDWSQGLGVGGVQYALIVSDMVKAGAGNGNLSRGDSVLIDGPVTLI